MLTQMSPPDSRYFNAHYFCDYIELVALVSNTDEVSAADIIGRFYDDDSDAFGQGTPEYSERVGDWESKVLDWFAILETRQEAYGDSYPFLVVSRNLISLKAELSEQHEVYLFFLLCSNLAAVARSHRSNLTSDFESIANLAFKKYLPPNSECHVFGKSANENDRYTGNIRNKVELFAEDIGCQEVFEDDFFAENDSGDYGLDIVAWSPIGGDLHLKNIQIYLGQCATGKDWLKKQSEPEKIMNAIHGIHRSIVTLFVPYDCRNSDRSFNDKSNITTSLIFDRCIIVSILSDNTQVFSILASRQLVLDAVQYQEDIV